MRAQAKFKKSYPHMNAHDPQFVLMNLSQGAAKIMLYKNIFELFLSAQYTDFLI
jgi:hypothetical protein